MQPITLKKNQYWGRRSGVVVHHSSGTISREIWVRPGAKKHVEGPKKFRHYTAILVENAIALGWCNGVRRKATH